MITESRVAALVPSSQRPVPLRRRPDLQARPIEFQHSAYWVVKDPLSLTYHRLQPEQYHLLQLLDGRLSLEELRDALRAEFPAARPQLADIQYLVADLHRQGLLCGERSGQGATLRKRDQQRQKLQSFFKNLLYIRLPGWDPDPLLRRLEPLVRWAFHPAAIAVASLIVCAAWMLLFVQFTEFQSRLPGFHSFFGWPNVIYLWLTLSFTKVVHEFGHALTAKHFGAECHEMSVMLLVFSPCLYCDVTDSWMLPNHWHRIWIAAAGMLVEIVLSAVSLFVWWFTNPGLLHYLSLNIFLVSAASTVLFNANPLMRFDGYYILSDLLGIPNLRPKAEKLLRDTFAWYCLGIESPADAFMPQSGRGWFVLYAIAATLNSWLLLFGITLFLYTWLEPYGLQSIGVTLAVMSLAGIVTSLISRVHRILTQPRKQPMSPRKLTATVILAGGTAAALLCIPIPWHIEASFVLEPHAAQEVHTAVPGRLLQVAVRPGDTVQAGQLLAVLENSELQDRHLALEADCARQRVRAASCRALDQVSEHAIAAEKLRGLQEQLAESARQLEQLRVRAPRAGRVVAAPRMLEPTLAERRARLGGWFGTPTDAGNLGAWLEERTLLLTIAPDEQMQAILYVDQINRDDIAVERPVEIRFEHLLDRTYAGHISTISERFTEFAPASLSNKQGGSLPTETDASGRERLANTVYLARLDISEDAGLLKPGLRGNARCVVDRRTAAGWIWRYVRRTFQFLS